MNRIGLKSFLVILLFAVVGCTNGTYNMATVSQQDSGSGYCHKKLQPIGPTDPAKPTQSRDGDYIDYYGPCDGPSLAEQIQAQRLFEQHLLTRDYNSEG